MKRAVVALAGILAAGGSYASEQDPWEPFNRKVYAFNDVLDRWLLKPAAEGYRAVTPDLAERGVTNFFGNIYEVRTIANDLLQGKFVQAGHDTTRLLLNTTVGLFGVVDVASRIELGANDEDFGQTLSVWGLPAGPYLMLPALGPSTLTDAAGRVPEMSMELMEVMPEAYWGVDNASLPLSAGYGVVKRAQLLQVESMVAGDRYAFIRDAYLQRRAFQVSDGQIDDDLLLEDMGEDFFEE